MCSLVLPSFFSHHFWLYLLLLTLPSSLSLTGQYGSRANTATLNRPSRSKSPSRRWSLPAGVTRLSAPFLPFVPFRPLVPVRVPSPVSRIPLSHSPLPLNFSFSLPFSLFSLPVTSHEPEGPCFSLFFRHFLSPSLFLSPPYSVSSPLSSLWKLLSISPL